MSSPIGVRWEVSKLEGLEQLPLSIRAIGTVPLPLIAHTPLPTPQATYTDVPSELRARSSGDGHCPPSMRKTLEPLMRMTPLLLQAAYSSSPAGLITTELQLPLSRRKTVGMPVPVPLMEKIPLEAAT